MHYFVDVILPIPVDRFFTYAITEVEYQFIKPGMRIAVPFGKTKLYSGLAYEVHQSPPLHYEAKDIYQILDDEPVVNILQLQHWVWLASYYMCSVGEVYRAAIPGAFLLESETIIEFNAEAEVSEENLDDDAYLVYEALLKQPALRVMDVNTIIAKKRVLPVIKQLLSLNAILVKEEIYEQYKPKLIRFVRLAAQFTSDEGLQKLLEELSRAAKQREVILTLFSLNTAKKPVKVTELTERSGASSSIIKALIDKEILEEFYLQEDRINFDEEGHEHQDIVLNEYQQNAFEAITNDFEEKDVVLLHGVTSSGKTEIYIKHIEAVIAEGKQVLYMLPEISLTTQLITRLQNYFGGKVAVYHSKYSVHERVEIWNNVLNAEEKAQVVIGARSAVFLPFSKLGLVVVDEEHENSYKQYDPAPRYHARDAAIVLAKMHQAKTLLGSATPSLESYFNALQNKYGLIELTRRYGNVLLPDMELVDIKEARRKKRMKGHFSERLFLAIEETLLLGEQVILFQNRRGYAPILECESCGHSPQCPNCDVSLTYHQYKKQLRCHYCGYHMALQVKCLACGSDELDTKGVGTEQIEEELKELFPDASVARMDQDTTRGKYAFEKIITAFEQQEVDILVGTQMLSKGLDFKNVTLVGVINADSTVNFPDFRAHERSFQLLQQVAGRSGRFQKRGKVLIQTFNPYHRILQQVTVNDYAGMVKEQLEERYHYKYPPYYKLIKITCKHKDYAKVEDGAAWLAKSLRNVFRNQVLGPEFPPVSRVRNQYIKNILIKVPPKQSLQKTKEAIRKVENSFNAIADYRSVRIIINVDNY